MRRIVHLVGYFRVLVSYLEREESVVKQHN